MVQINLEHRLDLAKKMADVSANIICQYFRQPALKTETKTGEVSSLVTIADKQAEEAMVKLILKEAPEDGIIREEGDNLPSKNGCYWVLDPIDGTSSFVKGLPIFGTLIALVDFPNNTPLIGLVNQPILQERWLGMRGEQTTFNGQPVFNFYADQDSLLQDACLTSTTPLMFISPRQKAIARKLQQVCQRTAFGGDCYNYVTLAQGWCAVPMVVLEADLKYYDFCAIIPILEGAGALIRDWQGNPLTSESTEVLAASNLTLLEQALTVISSGTSES